MTKFVAKQILHLLHDNEPSHKELIAHNFLANNLTNNIYQVP